MGQVSELLLCLGAAALAARAARAQRGANALFWWLLGATSVLWLGGRMLSPLLGLAAYAALAGALPLGFRGVSRVGLARRLVDLSAVAAAIGGAGFVLAVAEARTPVEAGYAAAATLL